MEGRMIVFDENGDAVNLNVIAKWDDYVAYTDNDSDELTVSKCIERNGKQYLSDITDDNEWKEVTTFLDEYLNDWEEEDE